ncbi:uncharacterized protein LOC127247235 [Andrographis paniculata]|uniref:uncharacterized protein LOC127247235 n=1 Tax=Andrographis paniculata TaxID=175694 RepID=UPI0021E6E2B7|nr:uncharacterized protein LOC127247235 [Andrographis paniculata]XP_051124970.1 uncharacterized protein LOC127247235 [Andrographis paniculata]
MPSIKMKAKLAKDRSKGKHGLHRCCKSSLISKSLYSHSRVCQNADKSSTCTPCNQDGEASVYDEICVLDLGGNETVFDESSNEENLFLKHPLSVEDFSTVDSMEPTFYSCTTNIETIFSPISESTDLNNNEGSDNFYVPQLDSEDSDDCSRSSDLYVSDMIFSAPSNGSSSVIDDETNAVFPLDFRCGDSALYCDLMKEYMTLPFSENALDTGSDHDGRPSEENFVNVDNSSLYTMIHQLRPNEPDSDMIPYPDQEYEGFDPQVYIRNLPDQHDIGSILSPNSIPNKKQDNKQITLVLDLDETLVHSTLDQCDDADFTFPVFFNMKEHTVYVKKRPHLQTFLKRVAEMFEIVVFTASQSIYAEQLLDIIDPDGKFISRRAYRESCIFSEGSYMKDLTVLGVDLAKVAIIDNSPQVFRLQVNNGIPIRSWFDDPSDCALISLLPFLETLVDAEDVRPIIARKFGNKE